jgi:hypothetical protein
MAMEISIANSLAEELGGDVALGGDELDGFRAEIGDAPIAISLAKLQRSLGAPEPPPLLGRFELLLVPHRFSLIKTRGWAEVVNVGLRIGYDVGDRTCSIVSLMPEVEYVSLGGVQFQVTLGANGETQASIDVASNFSPVGGGAKLAAKLSSGASLALRGDIATPRISAVGKGSRKCEWQFALGSEPLHGRDVETWSVLAVPRGLAALRYTMKLNVTQRTAFIPNRWESDIQHITCAIER